MKCRNCGTEFSEGIFCPECGTRIDDIVIDGKTVAEDGERESAEEASVKEVKSIVEVEKDTIIGQNTENEERERAINRKAIISLVLGIASWVSIFTIIIPIITTCWSIIDGIKALKGKTKHKKKAIIGIVLSGLWWIMIVCAIIWTAISVSLYDDASSTTKSATSAETNSEKIPEIDEEVNSNTKEAIDVDVNSSTNEDIGDDVIFDYDVQNQEPDYSQWEGIYQREHGPSSTVLLYSVDSEGIIFSIGIGASGYAAYVDIRDYFAEWDDGHTASYVGSSNYILYITLNEDGSISLEDTQPYDGRISLSGAYARESEAEFPDCEFVFPKSSYEYVAYAECEGLSELECRIARNEIYARHGRLFTDESLQGYFDTCTWYEGTVEAGDFSESALNEYELENLNTIIDYEEQMGYR